MILTSYCLLLRFSAEAEVTLEFVTAPFKKNATAGSASAEG